MSSKLSSRPRKTRAQKSEEMRQEIVAQVHKTIKRESTTSSTTTNDENVNKASETEESSGRSTSNKTFIVEDKNENYSLHTPSRDVSVDEEAQINSKILSLIETEMKRDINKHSHFTDSRPQSLSFYEDEKIPEELSGNLELLSPEERKHYRRRKDYIDMDLERNAYNNLQDSLMTRCESEDIIGGSNNGFKKSSKSRSKKSSKHSGDPELGLGDSREMMIPKEKRKSKKKSKQQRLENSPVSSSSKRKHRKREEDLEQPQKSEIALALEELQDDVFEVGVENNFVKSERSTGKKSPSRKSANSKHYVQRKSKFELTNPPGSGSNNMQEDGNKDLMYPIQIASGVQKYWLPLTLVCHGFLGGIALGHYFYLRSNSWSLDQEDFYAYCKMSDVYTYLFYALCVVCIVSVFDRYDLSHIDAIHLKDLLDYKKSSVVVLIYAFCLMVHLIAARTDDKFSLLYYNINNYTSTNITISRDEISTWNNLSYWRSLLAIFGWLFVACAPQEDLFYAHIKNMIRFVSE